MRKTDGYLGKNEECDLWGVVQITKMEQDDQGIFWRKCTVITGKRNPQRQRVNHVVVPISLPLPPRCSRAIAALAPPTAQVHSGQNDGNCSLLLILDTGV